MTEKKEEKKTSEKEEKKTVKKETTKSKKETPEKKELKEETKQTTEKSPATEESTREGAEKKVEKDEDKEEAKQTLLVETDKYLNTGAHIGTKFKSGDMKRYIYKVRKDGLNVLDVQTLDKKLGQASKFIAQYPKDKVVVVSRKVYGQTPAKAFADAIGATIMTGRFIPGTFTNPQSNKFIEPMVVVITDPEADSQAIKEATRIRAAVVAMASTNNSLRNIDVAVPINNKGKKSLALGYWIMAKEILKERGDIKNDSAFSKQPEDFEYKMKEGEEEEKKNFARRDKFKSFTGPRRGPPRGGSRY